MIVVGILAGGSGGPGGSGGHSRDSGGHSRSSVSVIEIARRAAAADARTEVVGVVPAGAIGDRQLVELAAARVGHATVVRSAAPGIEPADLDLALRYLPDVRVVVMVAPSTALLATASTASAWSGATLIVVGTLDAAASAAAAGAADAPVARDAPVAINETTFPAADDALTPIVLEPPAHDPDGAFAGVVAALAVRLDAGEDPASAWRSTIAALAIDPA